MRSRKTFCLMAGLVVALTAAVVSPAHAAVLEYSGTFTADDAPTMAVVSIATPACASQGSTQVAYREFPIVATADGDVTVSATTIGVTGMLMSAYLMEPGWDPAAALSSCLAGANNGSVTGGTPSTFTYPLVSGEEYVVVVFDDTFTQFGGGYELTIDGPVRDGSIIPTPSTRPEVTVPPTVPPTSTTRPATTTTVATTTSTTAPTTAPQTTTTVAVPPSTAPAPARPTGVGPAVAARPLAASPDYTG